MLHDNLRIENVDVASNVTIGFFKFQPKNTQKGNLSAKSNRIRNY